MILTVDIILQELEIRINKLMGFESQAAKDKDVDLHKFVKVRRQEYESFKQWIEKHKEIG